MRIWIPILFVFMLCEGLFGQTSHKLLRSADKLFDKQDFQAAEETYRKANEKKPTFNGEYNLGNAIYNQSRFEEALNHYEQAATLSADPNIKSEAYYNLGNTYMNMEDYEKGAEAYKNALRNNPNDEDSKYNLSVANRIVKQQQQQQQQEQQQQDQEKKEEQEQEDQQDQEQDQQQQEQQQQQEGDEEKEGDENEQESDGEEKEQEQEGEPGEQEEKKDLSKEEARRLLEVVEEDEKRTQQKLRKSDTNSAKPKKDW